MLAAIWDSNRFTKFEKLSFMYDVIKQDFSIKGLAMACNLMDRDAKIQKNIIAYNEYLTWWEKNSQQYPNENTPTSSDSKDSLTP